MSAAAATADFLQLHPKDNVLICARSVPAGSSVTIEGQAYTLEVAIELGHKIARVPLARGDLVYRYGAPIGVMTADAKPGQHVHSHNLTSRYLPAHDRTATGPKVPSA
jgi:SAF domain